MHKTKSLFVYLDPQPAVTNFTNVALASILTLMSQVLCQPGPVEFISWDTRGKQPVKISCLAQFLGKGTLTIPNPLTLPAKKIENLSRIISTTTSLSWIEVPEQYACLYYTYNNLKVRVGTSRNKTLQFACCFVIKVELCLIFRWRRLRMPP